MILQDDSSGWFFMMILQDDSSGWFFRNRWSENQKSSEDENFQIQSDEIEKSPER